MFHRNEEKSIFAIIHLFRVSRYDTYLLKYLLTYISLNLPISDTFRYLPTCISIYRLISDTFRYLPIYLSSYIYSITSETYLYLSIPTYISLYLPISLYTCLYLSIPTYIKELYLCLRFFYTLEFKYALLSNSIFTLY